MVSIVGGEEKMPETNDKEYADEKPETQGSPDGKTHDDDREDLKERLLRLAAEFDNYKKRIRADVDNAKDIGKAEVIKSLLPALDEFELALSSIGDGLGKKEGRGFELVYSNIKDTLKKEGLNEVPTNGKYDPYRHEIIMSRRDGTEHGTIIEVVKKGYTLKNILLRPAVVIISDGAGGEDRKI